MVKKLFYSVSELTNIFGVSKSLIYKQVDEQKIPAKRIGSRILIPGTYVEKQIGISNNDCTETVMDKRLLA